MKRLIVMLLIASSLGAQGFQTRAPDVTITMKGDGRAIVVQPPPKPEWVPDPSAGHYDCPDGWTASQVVSLEPGKWTDPYHSGPRILPSIVVQPPRLDKKGHEIHERPAPPICIKDTQ